MVGGSTVFMGLQGKSFGEAGVLKMERSTAILSKPAERRKNIRVLKEGRFTAITPLELPELYKIETFTSTEGKLRSQGPRFLQNGFRLWSILTLQAPCFVALHTMSTGLPQRKVEIPTLGT